MKTNMSKYMKQRRTDRRNALIWIAGSRCVRCYNRDNLEFDHIDPNSKSFGLSGCYLDKSWLIIYQEYLKCQLLCRSCHSHKTVRYLKNKVPWNKILSPKHASSTMYNKPYYCKCIDCTTWKRNYRNKVVDSQNNPL